MSEVKVIGIGNDHAAVGVGIYPNFREAADSMIRVDKEYIPNICLLYTSRCV